MKVKEKPKRSRIVETKYIKKEIEFELKDNEQLHGEQESMMANYRKTEVKIEEDHMRDMDEFEQKHNSSLFEFNKNVEQTTSMLIPKEEVVDVEYSDVVQDAVQLNYIKQDLADLNYSHEKVKEETIPTECIKQDVVDMSIPNEEATHHEAELEPDVSSLVDHYMKLKSVKELLIKREKQREGMEQSDISCLEKRRQRQIAYRTKRKQQSGIPMHLQGIVDVIGHSERIAYKDCGKEESMSVSVMADNDGAPSSSNAFNFGCNPESMDFTPSASNFEGSDSMEKSKNETVKPRTFKPEKTEDQKKMILRREKRRKTRATYRNRIRINRLFEMQMAKKNSTDEMGNVSVASLINNIPLESVTERRPSTRSTTRNEMELMKSEFEEDQRMNRDEHRLWKLDYRRRVKERNQPVDLISPDSTQVQQVEFDSFPSKQVGESLGAESDFIPEVKKEQNIGTSCHDNCFEDFDKDTLIDF